MLLVRAALAAAIFTSTVFSKDVHLSIREVNDTILHLPYKLNPDSFGILLALHGLGDNYPDNFQRATEFDKLSEETNDFVTVYPLGSTCIGSEGLCGHTWNGGNCCFSLTDDESFLVDVVSETLRHLADDEGLASSAGAPIFLVGFSAGGVMAHRMACQHSDLIRSVVSVSGPISFKECSPSRPISVMHVHGTLDPVFPWFGGIIGSSVPATMDHWKTTNGCNEDDVVEEDLALGISATTWANCSTENVKVVLVKEVGGLHTWPPARMEPERYFLKFFQESLKNL